MRKKNNGVVLIMVLAVLTVLSLIGVMLTRLASIERTTSRAYRDLVQAKMLAESGIFYGITTTRALLTDDFYSNAFMYMGEDLNNNGSLDALEDSDKNNKLEIYDCPLRRAVRPSFMLNKNDDKDKDGNPVFNEEDLMEMRKKKLGVTAEMSQTDGKNNFFSIRVTDLSSCIYVNMVDHPWIQNILENLAEEIGLSRAVGTKIYQNRGKGYHTFEEIKDKADLTDDEYNKIKCYLTVYAWQDKTVVKSVPLEKRIGAPKLGAGLETAEIFRPIKIEFPCDTSNSESGYLGEGELEPVGRAPVNVNTAPKAVLVALLKGLKGWYLAPATGGGQSGPYDILYGTTHTGGVALGSVTETPEITLQLARQIADAIIANRTIKNPAKKWEGRFKSWQQFNLFCDNVLWKSTANPQGFLTAQQSDVIKANFNSNSNINDFNPDFHRIFWVDKTDLAYFTTEFIFYPTGYFAIDSIGRVFNSDNKTMLAEAEISSLVKLFEIYRETTQSEFLYENWKNDVPIRGTIISENSDQGLIETTNNLALQTFPELPDVEYLKNANYDGYISLATLENKPEDVQFRANFNEKGLDADVGPSITVDTKGPYKDALFNQADNVAWRCGKLFPDGVYSETESVPIYSYVPANMDMVTVSMWIKPQFFPEFTSRTRVYFTYQFRENRRGWWGSGRGFPYGIYSIWRKGDSNASEILSTRGYSYGNAWDNASFIAGAADSTGKTQYAGGVGSPCLNHQGHSHEYITRGTQQWGNWFRAGKWIHVGWVHDITTQARPAGHVARYNSDKMDLLYINGQKVIGQYSMGGTSTYLSGGSTGYLTGGYGGLRLGERKSANYMNSAPDSTLDEVIVWENLALADGGLKISEIWNEGRYYKRNDGSFTSREIDLVKEMGLPKDSSVTLLMANWTQYRPDTLPTTATCEVSILDAKSLDPITEPSLLNKPDGTVIRGYGNTPANISEPIRYRVYFRPDANINTSVVDSLIFDDITLIYYASPRFLSWSPVP
ncbi:MAG: hypothetical protein HY811_01685 [Planctomycetes bacterium]|nr:hypothetical protein [Planctomycetota bacterium]